MTLRPRLGDMVKITLPSIYPITDTRLCALSHAQQVREFIAGGAQMVQLRDKHAPPRDVYSAAVEAIDIARGSGARIIINDRVDIALCAGADGVHLGQEDMPPEAARRVLGDRAIIGFSTHSVQQAVEAVRHMPVDYIAIGPIFGTSTKDDPDPVVGLDGLLNVRDAVGDFPLVAIGGITRANAASVFAAGADSVAVISDLLADPSDLKARVRSLAAQALRNKVN